MSAPQATRNHAELDTVRPRSAQELLAEHAELRKALETLAIHIELHAVPERDAQELIARLREHGKREDLILYPWLERNTGT